MTHEVTQRPRNLFTDSGEVKAFLERYRSLARARSLTNTDVLLHTVLLQRDALAVMPPTRNPRRLANGALGCSGFARAHWLLNLAIARWRQLEKCRARGEEPRPWLVELARPLSQWVEAGALTPETLERLDASLADAYSPKVLFEGWPR